MSNLRTKLISAVSTNSSPRHLKLLLSLAVTSGLLRRDPFVSARLVAALSSLSLPLSLLAFSSIPSPSAFAFNSVIRAASSSQSPSLSFSLFSRFLSAGLYPDRFVFPFLFRACVRVDSSPSRARSFHALALRFGLAHDAHVGTSLLHAYASWGLSVDALQVFDEMPDRTVVTYNAVVSRFAMTGSEFQGLSLFADMLVSVDRPNPNVDTFIAALSCSAGLGSLAHGRTVHALAVCLLDSAPNAELGTSLIHMYAKCGSLAASRKVFCQMETKDASAWTAMIAALAMHSRGEDAVQLFDEMVKIEGMLPDSVTFTCVLHACSHSGLAEKGLKLFDEMKRFHGIDPRMEHYGAVVDLLCRAGRVAEAKMVVDSMPFEPNRVVWGSLLHACFVNGESHVPDHDLEKRVLSGAEGVGFFVGVSNMYARNGRWDEVEKVREKMVERGEKKEKGFSLVEVNGKVFKFLVGDVKHHLTEEMYQVLDWIYEGMGTFG